MKKPEQYSRVSSRLRGVLAFVIVTVFAVVLNAVPAGASTAPDTPAIVSAIAGNASVALTFSDDSGGGDPITNYTATDSTNTYSCTTSGTGCTVTGLTNGTAYTFSVVATNDIGPSPTSAPSAAVTPLAPPPAPTGLLVTATSTGESLSWTGVTGTAGAPVTGYHIYKNGTLLASVTTAFYTDTSISAGTSAQYAVTAYGPGGESSQASVIGDDDYLNLPVATLTTKSTLDVTPVAMVMVGPGEAYVATSTEIYQADLYTGVLTPEYGSSTSGCTNSTNPTSATFSNIRALATDGTYLYVDTTNPSGTCGGMTIRRIELGGATPGATTTLANVFDFYSGLSELTYAANGYLYASWSGFLVSISTSTGSVTNVTTNGFEPNGTAYPISSLAQDGSALYVVSGNTTYGYNLWDYNLTTSSATEQVADVSSSTQLVAGGPYLYAANAAGNALLGYTLPGGAAAVIAGTGVSATQDGTGEANWPGGDDAWLGGVTLMASDAAGLWILQGLTVRYATAGTPTSSPPEITPPSIYLSPAQVTTSAELPFTPTTAPLIISPGVALMATSTEIYTVNLTTGDATPFLGSSTSGCANGINPSAITFSGIKSLATDGTYLYVDTINASGTCGGMTIRRVALVGPNPGATITLSNVFDFTSGTSQMVYAGNGMLYTTWSGYFVGVNTLNGAQTVHSGNGFEPGGFAYNLSALTQDGNMVYVMSSGHYSNNLWEYNTSTNVATEISTGVPMNTMAAAGNYLYGDDGNVTSIAVCSISSLACVESVGTTTAGIVDGTGSSAKFEDITNITTTSTGLWVIDDGIYVRWVSYPGALAPSGGPIAPDETNGTGNDVEFLTQAIDQNNVNTATGNMTQSETDATMPGLGPLTGFGLTYNSDVATTPLTKSLGEGWTDSAADTLSYDPVYGTSVLDVTEGNGSVTRFTSNGSGGWSAPSRVMATLTGPTSGTYTFVEDHKTKFVFAAPTLSIPGHLDSVSDLNANQDTLAYNASGQLTTITDSGGAVITLTYNTYGQLVSVTGPMSRTTSYTYSTTSPTTAELLTSTDPGGHVTAYAYNGSGQMSSVTDPAGNVTVYTYAGGQVATCTNALGGVTTYNFTMGTNLTGTTSETSPLGATTTLTYLNGEMTDSTLSAAGLASETTAYTYDPVTDGVATETDPDGSVTSYTYDVSGDVLTSTNALGGVTTNTYDSLGDVLTSENPNAATTTNTYNSDGNLTSTSTPLTGDTGPGDGSNSVTSYVVNAQGLPSSSTNPLGGITTYTYNAFGEPLSVSAPNGSETTYTYNAAGEKTTEVAPDGNATGATPANYTTHYTYDNDANVLTTTAPGSEETINSYTAAGQLATTTDPLGNVTAYTYDALGDITQTTLANDAFTQATYDDLGDKLTSTDASGNTTDYVYNAYRELASSTNPLSEVTSYTHNGEGQVATETAATGVVTTNAYDADGNLIGISYSDTTPSSSYTYNDANQLTSMADASGTTDYTYNSFGQQTGATEGPSSTAYAHDLAGDTTQITYPTASPNTVGYVYNTSGQMVSLTDFTGQVTTFGYDASGNLTSQVDPNGLTITTTPNVDNAPSSIVASASGTTLASFGYVYNADNEVTSEADAGTGFSSAPTQNYTYTPVNQLSSVNSADVAYTGAGSVTTLANGTVQVYNAGSELTGATPTGGSATTFGYDANGNLTSATDPSLDVATYGYNAASELTSYSPASDGSAHQAATYSYYGNGLLSSETSGAGDFNFSWDTTGSLPLMLSDGVDAYIYGPGSTPIEQVDLATLGADGAAASTYLIVDALGSVRAATNDTGTLLGSKSFDVYGNPSVVSGAVDTPLGYTGQWSDPATGLLYLRARWYDPGLAAFLSVDPALAQTLQPYEYAGDDGVNEVDLSGLLGLNPVQYLGEVANDVNGAVGAAATKVEKGLVQQGEKVGTGLGQQGKWVDAHKAQIGVVIGAVALAATGYGVFGDAVLLSDSAAGALAFTAGSAATALDSNACLSQGNSAACAGMSVGLAAALLTGGAILAGAALPDLATAYNVGTLVLAGSEEAIDIGSFIHNEIH